MDYREFEPRASSAFVERIWQLDDNAATPGAIQRVVPDGRPELILNLGEPFEAFQNGEWVRQPRCFLAGQLTGPLLLRSNGLAKIIGIRFRADGARRVFGVPMQELTDTFLPLDRFDARSVREAEALLHAGDEDFTIAESVRRATAAHGLVDIARLARDLHLSTRQFERRFRDAVGITPKLFCRIQRFQRVFREIEAGRDWITAAQECGYYDQSHLVNDFREFAGDPPTALLAGDELARHFL